MENTGYESQELNHLGIIAGTCFEIELIKKIDEYIPAKGREVSVGEAVQAMILNAMGFVNRPLYLSPQFWANKPVETLIRNGLAAEKLNDDCLGDALDALAEKGVTETFAKVASHALKIYGIEHEVWHLDSTTISFEGAYNPDEDSQAIKITYGHAKQRPDLKQAVVSLLCSYKSAIPRWLEIHSGNKVDKTLFPEIIDKYLAQMEPGEEPCFIADSALYSSGNIASFSSRAKWITRVPETLTAAKQLVRDIEQENMAQAQQPGYKFCEVCSNYGDIHQRWLVVYSQSAYDREYKTLLKRIEKAKDAAEKELYRAQAQEYPTEQAAITTLRYLEQSWPYHIGTHEVKEIRHYAHHRGRPAANAEPTHLTYQISVTLIEDQNKIAFARQTLGKYILATNQMDSDKMPCSKILENYTAQAGSVERGFRFLKDPLFFASGLFLKKPERIMALIMIMGLSLLVYSLAERKLRLSLLENNETVPNQKGKPVKNPTLRWVFQMFNGIHILIVKDQSSSRQLVLNLTPLHRKIIKLLGVEVEKCYFSP